ncbi:MAG: hypothetical protein WC966_11900 [Bradymonadales bacterium]
MSTPNTDPNNSPLWPCSQLKRYILDKHWQALWPKSRIYHSGYQKTVSSIKALFYDPAYESIYDNFQDYCFQQGTQHNANALDKMFFDSVLVHDLIFWLGDKDREIRTDFPLDPKVYDCFGHMKASHFDLFKVLKRGLLGAVLLESVITKKRFKAWAGFIRPPKPNTVIMARLLPLNFQTQLLRPWLELAPEILDDVLEEFYAELAHMQLKFPQCSAEALLKIAGYHLYEAIVSRQRIAQIQKLLSKEPDIHFKPQVYTYSFPNPAQMPKLDTLPNIKMIDKELGILPLYHHNALHKTLREAIISRQDKTLEFIAFLDEPMQSFITQFEALISKSKYIKHVRSLNHHEIYRSIRHI